MVSKLINFQFPGLKGVHCVFYGRFPGEPFDEYAGNFSFHVGDNPLNVIETRQTIMHDLQRQGLENWAECRQVHGTEVIFEPNPTGLDGQDYPQADGLATSLPGLGLIIKTADCQPILLAHESGHYVMALHSGWRGNRADFPGRAVGEFCEHYKVSPKELFAVRGPSLGPAQAVFTDFAHEWGEDFAPWFDAENKLMNLWALTKSQLEKAGIPAAHIYGIDVCTLTSSDQFFSYRKNKDTGRQASLIWIGME